MRDKPTRREDILLPTPLLSPRFRAHPIRTRFCLQATLGRRSRGSRPCAASESRADIRLRKPSAWTTRRLREGSYAVSPPSRTCRSHGEDLGELDAGRISRASHARLLVCASARPAPHMGSPRLGRGPRVRNSKSSSPENLGQGSPGSRRGRSKSGVHECESGRDLEEKKDCLGDYLLSGIYPGEQV